MVGSCIMLPRIGRIAVFSRVCLALVNRYDEYEYKLTWFEGTGWKNTEYRTYVFSEDDHKDDLEGYPLDGDNATLVEAIESRQRRGKEGTTPHRERQKTLYKIGTQGWEDQGLQLSTAEREAAKVPEGKEVEGTRV